mgnify:CR=1 FL=1
MRFKTGLSAKPWDSNFFLWLSKFKYFSCTFHEFHELLCKTEYFMKFHELLCINWVFHEFYELLCITWVFHEFHEELWKILIVHGFHEVFKNFFQILGPCEILLWSKKTFCSNIVKWLMSEKSMFQHSNEIRLFIFISRVLSINIWLWCQQQFLSILCCLPTRWSWGNSHNKLRAKINVGNWCSIV